MKLSGLFTFVDFERAFASTARQRSRLLLCAASLLITVQLVPAQSALNSNLIVNGNAESGPAGTAVSPPVAIPGWTATGKPTVLSYGLTGYVLTTDPGPPPTGPDARGFNYFAAQSSSTLSQVINVSSAVAAIAGGNVKYTASAYLGSDGTVSFPPQMSVAFQNANGQTFSTVTLGPLGFPANGMSLQQQIGLVPPGTSQIAVTVTFASTASPSYADSLSLVLATLGTNPSTVLGTNLVVNGGAEVGPGVPDGSITSYIPGWSTTNASSVCPYGGAGWIQTTDPGPADRGANLFCGSPYGSSTIYQNIDVSPAATLIDTAQVTYEISAWLGGAGGGTSPSLTYIFLDVNGNQVGATATLGPASHGVGLTEVSNSAGLPGKTRWVRIALSFPNTFYAADDISFTLAAPSGPPTIFSSSHPGIESASGFGGFSAIAPGTWVEIYGSFLTSSPLRNNCGGGIAGSCWAGSDFNNGVAPTSLDGVGVSVGGQPAYIDYTSPTQVNALIPSNAPVGPSMVTVTNANGTSEPFPIYIDQTQPGLLAPPGSFVIGGKQYVAGILADGSFALPTNAIPGVASRPAQPGETVVFYGIGFGPTLPNFTAGTVVTQQNELATPIQFLFNATSVTPAYWGLAPSYTGLYQFNVVVPNVSANNALPLSFNLGGAKGSQTLYIAVGN
jgi:uncharacterized protein (TIGR03437 family)